MTEIQRKKSTGEPTSNGGHFGSHSRDAAEVSLHGVTEDPRLLPEPKDLPAPDARRYLQDPEVRRHLLALSGESNGGVDMLVHSILDGHLSRGVPGRTRVDALRAWYQYSENRAKDGAVPLRQREAAIEFHNGVADTVNLMFPAKPGETTAGFPDLLTQASWRRVPAAVAEHWRQMLNVSTSDANWRGRLVAAAALSGQDKAWGFRDDAAATIGADGRP